MNKMHRAALTLAICTACGGAHDDAVSSQASPVSIITAAGTLPAALPSHMMVGLFEQAGKTWMQDSGVPWDVRYAYFTYGWANNWGYNSARDGSWGSNFMQESDSHGFIPAVEYYCVNGEPGGGEDKFLAKTQNATTMQEYFGDFKLLMQNIKAFAKPVLVLMEADGYGYMQQQSASDPNAYAAVAASGVPELASLPNTVAGWGMAFLQLRKAVGADNAILGIHVSAWASGKDLAYGDVTISLKSEVDSVSSFLRPLGLAPNQTGATYDVLVGDPLDRDSDYYKPYKNQNRWWDASDSASVDSMSFNRYAAWLRLWNVMVGKRWILWQIPIGNSNQLDVCNSGAPRQGYKDNRPEYFFGTGNTTHLRRWAQGGVIGLLFGAGEGCQSSYENDEYTDGQLFMKSRVGAFYGAGGLPLTGAGASSSVADSGTASLSVTTTSTSEDSAQYGFETGTQGWVSSGGIVSAVASSTVLAFGGSHALAVTISATGSGRQTVGVPSPAVPAGATVTFHVWIPDVAGNLSAVQPYVLQGAAGNWTWTGNWQAASGLKPNAWNTITVTTPANAVTPLYELGVEFSTSGAWSGTAYIDSVSW